MAEDREKISTGPNEEPINETIAGTGPGIPDDALAPGEELPEAPSDGFCVLDLLDRVGSPATVANAGGRFFGFVNGSALPISVAATWIASAWDQNAASWLHGPARAHS